MKKKILFICGSLNQTTIMHKISMHLNEYDNYFTPYYADGYLKLLVKRGLLNFSILGGEFFKKTCEYLTANNLKVDFEGKKNNYDLVFTCSDLIIQKNIHGKRIILVQEGMTDPENIFFWLAKKLKLPRFLASTSTSGLSDEYDFFCVASEGYKNFFIKKGVKKEKIIVTGLPNFDNCRSFLNNNFPLKNFVLVATSDARETFKYENRKKFILNAVKIAARKKLVFKLHPNENFKRAIKEIHKIDPHADVYTEGNINEMIANCDTLITKYSSVVYVGMVLGKEVYSDFDITSLINMTPLQNEGKSALKIASIGKRILEEKYSEYAFEEIKKFPVHSIKKHLVTLFGGLNEFKKPEISS